MILIKKDNKYTYKSIYTFDILILKQEQLFFVLYAFLMDYSRGLIKKPFKQFFFILTMTLY